MPTIVLLVAGCSSNQGFEGYRYNPFQYPYPEYYSKADSIPIGNEKKIFENNMVKLEFFGLNSYISAKSFRAIPKEIKENKVIYKADDNFLIIHREKDNLLGCVDEQVKNRNRDFCSVFESTKEYYDKLFTLTPEELNNKDKLDTGHKWIVHRKGFTFENVNMLRKYVGKDFIAFESSYNAGNKMTKDMILFLDNAQSYYFTFSTNICDDWLFRKLLETIQQQ